MNKKDWDYQKYGSYMDPEDNIFFGPITIRELKASMAMADRIMEKRKKEKETAKLVKPIVEDSEENELNRTFEINDSENIDSTLEASKQPSKVNIDRDTSSIPLKDISNHLDIANDSMCDLSKLENSVSKNTNLLDDTCPTIVRKHLQTPLIGKKDVSTIPILLNNMSISRRNPLDDTCPTIVRKDLQTPLIGKKDIPTLSKNMSVSKRNPLDDSCPTIIRKQLRTPLMEKSIKKVSKNDISNSSINRTLTNDSSVRMGTPRTPRRLPKLSDTFITKLMPENCLINTSITEEPFSERASTPDIFKNKRNDIWRKNDSSSNVSSSADVSFKSRLPKMKRTPNKRYFPLASPVAEYIHKGKTIQSLSKPRHSHCLLYDDKSSHSDNKLKSCKIPVRNITSTSVARRHLTLDESEQKKTLDESKQKKKLFQPVQ